MKHNIVKIIFFLVTTQWASFSYGQDTDCPPVAVGTDSPCIDAIKAAAAAKAKAEADAKAAIPDLAAQTKKLNTYLNLIPRITAFANDTKSMTANYLTDNNSVSSIPRNYHSLVDRHNKWMTTLSAKVDASKPNFAAVVDGASYGVVLSGIETFKSGCNGDAGLSIAETRFVNDLATIENALSALQIRGSSLIQALNDPQFNGIGDTTLTGNIDLSDQSLKAYATQVEAMRQEIMPKQAKRTSLCEQIPTLWHSAAVAHFQQANVDKADALIASVEAALRGPKVSALSIAAMTNALAAIDQPLNNTYSPIHAQRALYAANALVPHLRQTVAQASIGSDMTSQISTAIDDFQKNLTSRTAAVQAAMANQTLYGAERQRLIKLTLAHSAATLSSDCSALAQKISAASAGVDSATSEDQYIQFVNNCHKR